MGNGTGTGTVAKVYPRKTTLKIEGTEITRGGSQDVPAYRIAQQHRDEAVKSHSALRKA
ncbi:HVA1 family protein [Salipiger sp. 1_MG-2023]|uniref:HVA1 family protein n=1 Tax=Salipiger sp. 1_MG-2023 TaxID=3062665 RepID=UPI0026E15C94|nr:HVA1 family protein [Salipiger sp. 1_MG-2023]MDO6584102.1 HVA1 family protein [Salipiger sp. 1_MG-2023]